MEASNINQQFRPEEISYIRRWDKEKNEYISNPFPKIGGRLRLAHEQNENLSIETEIIRYDEQIAVVSAMSRTTKGCFKGIGMASVERDAKIAPAILELAETRAIGRALRFAGYGVEYCSAEEVSHLGNGNGEAENSRQSRRNQNDNLPAGGNRNGDNLTAKGHHNGGNGSNNPGNGSGGNGNGGGGSNASGSNGGNGNGSGSNNPGNGNGGNGNGGSNGNGNNHPSGPDGNGNGNGRLSAKQYRYLQKLNGDLGRASADLDKQAVEMFGTVSQFLSKGDASAMIEHLMAQ